MPNQQRPKNWREVGLMLTALIPVFCASCLASSIPDVPAVPKWCNEIVDFICWALLCFIFISVWARLLHVLRLLTDEQLTRYPFGLGVGRK